MTDTPNSPSTPAQRWVKLPRAGESCQFSGLSQMSLYRLLRRSQGEIRTLTTCEPGKLRGNRLIDVNSLLAYLEKLAGARVEGGQK